MIRILIAVASGLLIAGIVHILVVLAIPLVSPMDNWTRVAGFGEEGRFVPIPLAGPESGPVPVADPTMLQLVCRFRQADGYVLISAIMPNEFWSFALYGQSGRTLFSLNNRTSDNNTLSMLVVSADQLARLRRNPPSDLNSYIIVETTEARGVAILRTFVDNPDRLAEVRQAISRVRCVPGGGSGGETEGSARKASLGPIPRG